MFAKITMMTLAMLSLAACLDLPAPPVAGNNLLPEQVCCEPGNEHHGDCWVEPEPERTEPVDCRLEAAAMSCSPADGDDAWTVDCTYGGKVSAEEGCSMIPDGPVSCWPLQR